MNSYTIERNELPDDRALTCSWPCTPRLGSLVFELGDICDEWDEEGPILLASKNIERIGVLIRICLWVRFIVFDNKETSGEWYPMSKSETEIEIEATINDQDGPFAAAATRISGLIVTQQDIDQCHSLFASDLTVKFNGLTNAVLGEITSAPADKAKPASPAEPGSVAPGSDSGSVE